MATTNQVNIVNVKNLPQTQQLFDGNYLIVQNDFGTQIIDWQNVGVLKLDLNGNGSYSGTLTGAGLNVSNVIASSLSSSGFFTSGKSGQTAGTGFYNTFDVTNGLITGVSSVFGSPEYLDIINTQIPASRAQILSSYPANYTSYGYITPWPSTNTSQVVVFTTLPNNLTVSNFDPTDFIIAQTNNTSVPILTSVPTFSNITLDGSSRLNVTVNTNQSNLANYNFTVKTSKFYTAS